MVRNVWTVRCLVLCVGFPVSGLIELSLSPRRRGLVWMMVTVCLCFALKAVTLSGPLRSSLFHSFLTLGRGV